LLAEGVTPTAKHFPGLGRVATDTHLFGASLDVRVQALGTTDWVPFKAVFQVPGAAIMLSHVALDDLDPRTPVSQSRRAVTDLLRTGWGFAGIAITDDLTMGAIVHTGLCRAVEGALNAGVDLLLVSWDTDKVYPALRCALDALEAGRLDRAMLDRSALRLQTLQGNEATSISLP
jgi:beta-N-acetylhexosaminidase